MALPILEMKPIGRTRAILLALGAMAGLAIKCRMLFQSGVIDMESYYGWGREALSSGLPTAYAGTYFPFQYQIFELAARCVDLSRVQFFIIFKLANLVFDSASFIVLLLLLRQQRSNPLYALIYWLHPWFLAVFSLGYCDFQFSFFVLLSILLLRGESMKSYLSSGLALGIAFVMKPQAQILLIAASCYCLCHYLRTRSVRPFALLVGPSTLFLFYEAVFAFALPPPRLSAALVLPSSYLNITNIMPALTAQMTNIWYPIAYLLKAPGDPIYAVSDQITLLPFLTLKYLAAAVVIGSVVCHVIWMERQLSMPLREKFLRMFAFAVMIVPFVMTSGHENHLFLGTLFVVLLVARNESRWVAIAGQILLLMQFLHIFSLYGEHPASLAQLLRSTQSDEVAIVYSLISLACFAIIAKALWTPSALPLSNEPESSF